ncbi:MAG: 50S ribosomal protein L28 [Myxococcota bacterium]|jgi:large subunit ribosomal protein L28|nr:50S ribosomal protein L28 [Myxococcota bacterium]
MPRRCALSGSKVSSGNNVSHSNRRTRRTFAPNLQNVTLLSDALGERVRLRVTARALRTVQKVGGIDAFLLGTDDAKLPPEAIVVKRRVRRAIGGVSKPV